MLILSPRKGQRLMRACRKTDWAGAWRLDCGWEHEEPDAPVRARGDECQTRVDREVRGVDVRLASLGNRQIMARKGEEGGVRENCF